RNVMQSAYQIQVAADVPDFNNPVWDSGKVLSDQSSNVEYKGKPLESRTCYYYRVQVWNGDSSQSGWSGPASWETGLLKAEEWIADWITPDGGTDHSDGTSCPFIRNRFVIHHEVQKARIFVTALGLYELHLNGERVGDWLFTPGWTSYNKRLQYQTYHVTDLVQKGENVVGVILGNGWYKGYLGWEGKNNTYGDKRALLLQMHVTYKDGREDIIPLDNTWKASCGPILMSEIYHGETYDARKEENNWCLPGFDDTKWHKTMRINHAKDILMAQQNVPVRKIEEIKPIGMIQTPKGKTIIDFGQNMVGWVKFKVKGPRGSKVILKHAEVLDSDGELYADNIRKAGQTIEYILKGTEEECFQPHFTFQGFRYVLLEEYPDIPQVENFTGVVIHSDMAPTGKFECSSQMINRLQHNIVWGQKGNFLDVPTDCPQRDERLGWTGDAQVFARTACFNMNTALFFTKWLGDLKADQLDDGIVPHVIPSVVQDALKSEFEITSACGWSDAAVIVPWTLYL
ncbi:MAG: family 78 glycoside hydrolase catalytic domain, partial [Firmicutes bacterium]|nr:family 78 glycoside hydrolase catalytic domain [Bacillota bacterium]